MPRTVWSARLLQVNMLVRSRAAQGACLRFDAFDSDRVTPDPRNGAKIPTRSMDVSAADATPGGELKLQTPFHGQSC